jgi:hypothetical protein
MTSSGQWRWLKALWVPSWVLLLSSAKDFSGNAVLGSRTLNSLGLHVWRKALAQRMCQSRRQRLRDALTAEVADQWDRTGIMRIDNYLTASEAVAVREELLCAALPMAEMVQPPALTRRANLDATLCLGRYPALYRLITDQRLLSLLHYAAGYRGSPVVAVQCIHSDDGDGQASGDPQTHWHSDTFHSTAKAWLFLHPVAGDEGPFAFVPGSHQLSPARIAWERRQSIGAASHPDRLHARGSFRATDDDLAEMGLGAPIVATVPGNTLIVADTSGFHRRCASPQPTVRVEIYFSLRRNPFLADLYPGLLALPWVKDRWAGWLYRYYKWMRRRGLPSWYPQELAGLNAAEKGALDNSPR